MGYSVGIGLTNDCNLSCAHCYRDVDVLSYVSLAQVKVICESLPVDAVGMGTGENALHPQFAAIVDYLAERGLPMSMASNGHSILSVPSETLRQFRDLEVSIDYPTQAGQDGHRGPGSWRTVHEAIERCHALGITVTVLTTLMSTNHRTVGAMVGMARRNGANLRVNVYQPVHTSAFTLSFEQFWEAFGLLYAQSEVISCSEPVVRAAMGLGEALLLRASEHSRQPAGRSDPLRVLAGACGRGGADRGPTADRRAGPGDTPVRPGALSASRCRRLPLPRGLRSTPRPSWQPGRPRPLLPVGSRPGRPPGVDTGACRGDAAVGQRMHDPGYVIPLCLPGRRTGTNGG